MYRHYDSSEDVFVDREEHIEWMDGALKRCKKKSVVLHLKGIGGIGKSSLLNHWINTHEKTISLDCEQYPEFYQRLNMLARGAVLHGIKLQRFDILWQIRQRFVEGVEPVREEGRQWAKEVVMAIPFIGSLASIGSAISAVGSEVTPRLKGKYSTIGKWLQETLGKNHIEQLLQILWKEPRRAEFLYLEALLEDINTRKGSDTPLVFLLDHFEYVDDTKVQWKYQRTKINETQLWTIFLCNLANCVGVLASRRSASDSKLINVEETELTELDRDSCFEMLELQDITDKRLQERIVSVSGGNPFVIDAICDMINTSDVSISDIEGLRADTLTEVRLKVWRRLFSHAEGLHNLINRAGILPYFDERIMRIIAPEMTPDGWDRLKRLSFIKMRSDGSFVLHDLAEDLVRTELGDNLRSLVDEVSDLLEKRYNDEADVRLLGLAISARALKEPKKHLTEFYDILDYNFSFKNKYLEGVALCNSIEFRTEEGEAYRKCIKSHYLIHSGRIADGEHEIREALEEFESISAITEIERKRYRAISLKILASLFMRLRRDAEADDAFEEAIALAREANADPPEHLPPGRTNLELSLDLWWHGNHLDNSDRIKEAEEKFSEAIEQWDCWANQVDEQQSHSSRGLLSYYQVSLGYVWMRRGKLVQAEAIWKGVLEDVQEPHVIGVIYWYLNMICLRMNRPFEALEWSEKAMNLFNEMPENIEAFLGAHASYARALHALGRYSEALREIEEVLQLAKEYREKAPEVYLNLEARRMRTQAVFLRQMGKTSDAEKTNREILGFLSSMTSLSPDVRNVAIAYTLNNRGVSYFKNGNFSKAEGDFSEGLELGKGSVERFPDIIDNVECIPVILNNLGNLYLVTGRAEEARAAFEEAFAFYDRLSKLSAEMVLDGRAVVLNNLGALLAANGELHDAEKRLKESLRIRRQLEERGLGYQHVRIGSTLNNLGIIHLKRKNISNALNMFQEATYILEDVASQSPLDCQNDLTRTLINQYIALSKIDSDHEKSEAIMKRLRKLGVKKVEFESYIWDVLESE
ncbi:MAG: tetratricopeptide repeat protein [Candidatus Thorarchaeota archaeon]